MSDEKQDVRAALRLLLGKNEKEIELMLGRYAGYSLTVRGFMRRWLEKRLGRQEWMLSQGDVRGSSRPSQRAQSVPAATAPGHVQGHAGEDRAPRGGD